MALKDKMDTQDLKQMLIGSLSVIGVYVSKQETTIMENMGILFAITVMIGLARVFFTRKRALPSMGGNAIVHILYAYLTALVVSFVIGGIILDRSSMMVTGVALIALPSTLLIDVIGGE